MPLHAIVFNPASGGRPRDALARRVAGVFAGQGHEVALLPTLRPHHATEMVASLLRQRPGEAIDLVALGGDGTLNEVVTGAYRAGELIGAASRVRVAPVPAGTTNVVARSLGLPRGALAAAKAMAAGGERLIDVGTCRVHAQKRPFLLACGVGFDAEVLLRVSPLAKRLVGQRAYQLAALLATGHRERGLVVEIEAADGTTRAHECASLIAGASERYAGTLRLTRDARCDDGLLDVVLLDSTRFVPLLRAAWSAGRTAMEDASGVRVVAAKAVRASAAADVPVHVDAEPFGSLPAEISVLAGALKVRVGR